MIEQLVQSVREHGKWPKLPKWYQEYGTKKIMKFERFLYNECKDYFKIHNEIFPEDPSHIPAIVYKGYTDDGKYLGFCSGYLHDKITFYIQRIGIPKKYRNNKLSQKIMKKIWIYLKSEGFRSLMGTIETTNTPAIIVALKTGWIIHGFRVDTSGKQYIEIIKKL